jgi:hypothetical protein
VILETGAAIGGFLFSGEGFMAVSISDRKWILDADGVTREKIEFMLDSPSDISLLPDPSRISASSVALIKPSKLDVFIVNGAWTELEQGEA